MTDPPTPGVSDPNRKRGVCAVVVRDARFLVICRSAHVVAPGAYCFPGGGIEAGERDAEALVREFQEELGAAIRPVRQVWTSVSRFGVELVWWLAELDAATHLLPSPAEVASIHWLTHEELATHPQTLASNRQFLAALAQGEIVLD